MKYNDFIKVITDTENCNLRRGQAIMIALHKFDPDTYDEITGDKNLDCFYVDDRIPSTMVYLYNKWKDMETKVIDITIEEARELYNDPKFKSIVLRKWTEEELFPKDPKTWEEIIPLSKTLFTINGRGVITTANIPFMKCTLSHWSLTIPTRKDAEKIIALCKISILADYYNGKSLNMGRRYSPIYNFKTNQLLITVSDISNYSPFVFYSIEYLQEAMDNNKEIFITALS